MPSWKTYDDEDVRRRTKLRPGETRVGEVIRTGDHFSDGIQVVILGIPEDIGVLANHGIAGTSTAWEAFLKAFLNMQAITPVPIRHCCLLGHLDCSDLDDLKTQGPITALRDAVSIIDREVERMIFDITAAGKLPLVIGGGHNNAYPIIKGVAGGYHRNGRIEQPVINAINLDAHADFRGPEGRHSGNGFRYAFQEEVLDRYAVIGLHRAYNAQSMIDIMAPEARLHYTFWEQIFLEESVSFEEAIDQAIAFTRDNICGIELDLDSLENQLSSAMSPSGLSTTMARRYLYRCARHTDPAYIHICEGAATMADGRCDPLTGKLIAYLVGDILASVSQSP